MRISIKLTGVTGLVQHNERLADPEDDYVKLIRELTGKRTKTESDLAEIGRLEWLGGLYHDPAVGVYVPTWNIVRCIERAGTITRKGASVIRALAVISEKVPVQYDGPRDVMKLWERPEFRLRKMVGVGGKRVVRVRPIFRRWSLELESEFLTDVMDPDEFTRIVEQAGRSEGLGDARKLGYGRFLSEVKTWKE